MLEINLYQLPDITTKRLVLRQQTITDAPVLFGLRTNPAVMRYIDRPKPNELSETEEFIASINKNFHKDMNMIWAITLKENPGQMIGNLGYWRIDFNNYRAEIGYMLQPDYWRQGILSEALAEIIDFGFTTVGLHSICANINPSNDASRQLLLKHGFVKEAYFKEDYYFEGRFLDSEIYGLLEQTFRER